jgi:hypothetical protein
MWTRATQTLMLFGLIGLGAVGVAQEAPSNSGANAARVAAQPVAAGTANAQKPGGETPLGDLSPFRAIAVDTLRIVNTGDLGAAKKRIKDLELSWDQAEPKLKPLAPQKWETVDGSIDRALKEVRAWRTTPAASSEVLQALISTIDGLK